MMCGLKMERIKKGGSEAVMITKEFVEDLLNSKGKKKCLFKAKPEGLYLQEVYYEENY